MKHKGLLVGVVSGIFFLIHPFLSLAQTQTQPASQPTTSQTGYTLPESYYNSLKGSNPQVQTTSQEPVAEQTTPQTETITPNNTEPAKKQTLWSKLAHNNDVNDSQPLPTEFNTSYLTTELGSIRADIESLKKGISEDQLSGYDGGFFIKTADNEFKLSINGRLQGRYSFNIAEDTEDGHTLALKSAYFTFGGNLFTEKLTYFMLVLTNVAPGLGALEVVYSFFDEFALRFAYDNIVNSTLTTSSGGKLMFITRSLASKRFDVGDSLQISASGNIAFFSYYVSVANSPNTDYEINANTELSYAGRFDFNVFGKLSAGEGDLANTEKPALSVGFSVAYGHYDQDTQARLIHGTADVTFKYRGSSFIGAGFFRQIDPNQFTRAQYDAALVGQASYFVIPKKLELAIRAGALFDDLTDSNNNLYMSTGNETSLGGALSGGDVGRDSYNEYEYAACIGYYFTGFTGKIQAQYSMIIDGIIGPDDLVNHVGLVQFTVGF